MPNTIKVKRGTKTTLPTLEAGELAFTTDTKEIYIGDGTKNYEIVKKTETDKIQVLTWLGV